METEIMFRVEIDKEVNDKMDWFTQNYDKEISGWLVGDIEKDLIKITDILIPHQEVGGASVDTDGKSLIKLRKEYGDKCLKIIGHYHSHNTMSNFWSTTDESFISQYMEQRERGLFIVSSKGGGHRVRLELRVLVNLSIDELEYSVGGVEDDILGEELRKVIKEKITENKNIVVVDPIYNRGSCKRIYGSRPLSNNRNNENFTLGLTKQEINKIITFYNKKNRVVISDLTPYQYGRLEDLGKHDCDVVEGVWTMDFKPKNKKDAQRIMREARGELMRDNWMAKEDKNSNDIMRDLEEMDHYSYLGY